MEGSESRGVDVVRVRNALITHSFVATKNVAVSEDNAQPHTRSDSSVLENGAKRRSSALGGLLKRRSTNRDRDPVSPFLRQVLQALMDVLRPTELCRLLTSLETATTLRNRKAGALEAVSSLPDVLDTVGVRRGADELFVALISNRLSGVEEDALFILRALDVPASTKRISLRRAQSLQRLSISGKPRDENKRKSKTRQPAQAERGDRGTSPVFSPRRSSISKEAGSFVADSLSRAPSSSVKLAVLKVLPIWSDLRISLKGRGLVRLNSSGESVRIGTVSVVSMWRLVTALTRARAIAKTNNLFPQGPSHKWVSLYQEQLVEGLSGDPAAGAGSLASSRRALADIDAQAVQVSSPPAKEVRSETDGPVENVDGSDEDDYYDDDESSTGSDFGSSTSCSVLTQTSGRVKSHRSGEASSTRKVQASQEEGGKHISDKSRQRLERQIVDEIRTIIQNTLNLDDLTTAEVIRSLEKTFGKETMSQFKKAFIDEKIIQIYGQQDPPSRIEDWLYLGTEYNASNLTELDQLGITEIVNVTLEIKDFYPGLLDYYRVAVKDRESADLFSHLDAVCSHMAQLEKAGKRVLVHCQRGISRSATVVIAYLMHRDRLSHAAAMALVKKRRSIIKPNKGFAKQLDRFEKATSLAADS